MLARHLKQMNSLQVTNIGLINVEIVYLLFEMSDLNIA